MPRLITILLTVMSMLCGIGTAKAQQPAELTELLPDFARSVCGWNEGDDQIIVPDGVTELPDFAFYEMQGVRSVSLPPSLTRIGRSAFAWMGDLEEVNLPGNLTDIGAHAFAYCAKLRAISLPEGLTHIGNNAFSRCESLGDVRLPLSLTELESYAFSDCFSLRATSLPANASLLGELIFSGCRRLSRLECLSPTPPPFDCRSFIFEPDDSTAYRRCRLTVPADAVDAYSQAPGWKLFPVILGL